MLSHYNVNLISTIMRYSNDDGTNKTTIQVFAIYYFITITTEK
jgi:hypothetical protein